jgi:DivIVA domain-containing protein
MDSANSSQSALDVLHTVEFKLGLKGYNVDEVDEFLERAAVEADHLKDQLRQQQLQLRQAAERINQLEAERRSVAAIPPAPAAAPAVAQPAPATAASAPMALGAEQITRMIGLAQQFVDQTQQQAEARARELTVAAQDKAREIVADAQNRAQDEVTRLNGLKQRLSEDVDRLVRQVDAERSRLRSQLTEFLRWVEENLQSPLSSNAPVVDRIVEPALRENAPAAASMAAPVTHIAPPPSAPSAPSSVAPPPAPARNAPSAMGQILNFDSDERS